MQPVGVAPPAHPQSAAFPHTAQPTPPGGLRTAHWYIWGLIAYFVTFVGLSWDGAWHAMHRFDSFFSPPHVFVYANAIITIRLVANLTFRARLRQWFGRASACRVVGCVDLYLRFNTP